MTHTDVSFMLMGLELDHSITRCHKIIKKKKLRLKKEKKSKDTKINMKKISMVTH